MKYSEERPDETLMKYLQALGCRYLASGRLGLHVLLAMDGHVPCQLVGARKRLIAARFRARVGPESGMRPQLTTQTLAS